MRGRPDASVVRRIRGTTFLELLVALALLGLVLGTVAAGLAAWQGQFRRAVAAWRCREALAALRVQASAGQVVCGRPAREIQRGACRVRFEPTADCTGVRVELRLGGPGLHGTVEVLWPLEGVR